DDGNCTDWHESEGQGNWSSAAGTITVYDVVTAANDSYATHVNVPLPIDALANDSDSISAPLTITNYAQPSHGTLSLLAGTLVYTPETDYFGPDSFTYT